MKHITEASHPGMTQTVRNKLAKNLRDTRKASIAAKDPHLKNILRNTAVYDATTYNPEVTRQMNNNTTPVSRYNNKAHKSMSTDGKELKKKNYFKMNIREDTTFMVNFKNRILEENYGDFPGSRTENSLGSSIGNNIKSNWKKYLGGAAAGAGAAALADHFNIGGIGDFNDDMQKAATDNNYWDTGIGKLQKGLDHLKSSDAPASGTTASSGDSASSSNSTSSAETEALKSKLDKITGENKMYKYLAGSDPKQGDGQNNVLYKDLGWLDRLSGETSGLKQLAPDQVSDQYAQREMGDRINAAYDNWSHTNESKTNNLREIIKSAAADGNITPEEISKIQGAPRPDQVFDARDAVSALNKSIADDGTKIYQDQSIWDKLWGEAPKIKTPVVANLNDIGSFKEALVNNEFTDIKHSLDYINKNKGMFGFLLDNNTSDDLNKLSYLKDNNILPPELEPIYDRLRQAAASDPSAFAPKK